MPGNCHIYVYVYICTYIYTYTYISSSSRIFFTKASRSLGALGFCIRAQTMFLWELDGEGGLNEIGRSFLGCKNPAHTPTWRTRSADFVKGQLD